MKSVRIAELKSRLSRVETAAIIKVGRHLPKIRRVLEELGLEQRACYVEHATLDSQRVMPLAEAAEANAPYFSMILVRSAA